MENKKEEIMRLFMEAMESSLPDNEKEDIINDLYEIMDIWGSVLGM